MKQSLGRLIATVQRPAPIWDPRGTIQTHRAKFGQLHVDPTSPNLDPASQILDTTGLSAGPFGPYLASEMYGNVPGDDHVLVVFLS